MAAEFVAKLGDKKTKKEACEGLQGLIEAASPLELIAFFEHVPAMLECVGEKDKKTQQAGEAVISALLGKANPWSARTLLPHLAKGLDGKSKPATKEFTLKAVEEFSKTAPTPVARELDWLIHPIVFLMNDI